MTRSAARATRWSRTGASFAADLALYLVLALAFWLVLPMLALGWTPVLVTSGSMSPAVEPGDVLLVQRGVPDGEWYAPGTILTFLDAAGPATPTGTAAASGDDEDRLVTHRVDRVVDGAYVTRGDANASVDIRPVEPEQVVGAARLLIPYLGLPVHWARDGRVLQLGLVVLVLAGTVSASRWDAMARRRDRAEDGDLEVVATHAGATDDGPAAPPGPEEAVRVGALAARAARAGAASARPPGLRDEPDEVETRRREAGGAARGFPPAGAVLAVLALTVGAVTTPSHAAFADASSNGSNRFSTAPAEPPVDDVQVTIEIHDEWGTGYCAGVTVSTPSPTPVPWEVDLDLTSFPLNGEVSTVWEAQHVVADGRLHATGLSYNATVVENGPVTWGFCATRSPADVPTTSLQLPLHQGEAVVAGGVGSGRTVTYDQLTFDEDLYLAGSATARIYLRRQPNLAGNSGGAVTVTLSIDGVEVAGGGLWNVRPSDLPDWEFVDIPLTPTVIHRLEAGAPLQVEVHLDRMQMEVDGPSEIVLGGA